MTPAQLRVMTEVMSPGVPRPHFDAGLAGTLRDELEKALGPDVAEIGADPLAVNKRSLGQVLACESHYQAETTRPFEWTVPTAVGTVVHRAVELSVTAGHAPPPLDLVTQAIESLTADDPRNTLRPFLVDAPPAEIAELRARANEVVVKFRECWPPLKASWIPRAEMRIRTELCDGRVVLVGKVDLALGLPRGDEARELFVDLKTGRSYRGHLEDLRFYALVQVLRAGVPPFRVASYYFDSATFHAEDVTEDVLEIAIRRTVDGIQRMSALRLGRREPSITPGPACTFCSRNTTCPGAVEWSERHLDDED